MRRRRLSASGPIHRSRSSTASTRSTIPVSSASRSRSIEMRRPTPALPCSRPSMSLQPSSWSPVGSLRRRQENHAAWFLDLAIDAEPHLPGPSAVSWLDRLESDHDNLRAALDWLRARGDGERAVTLAAALWRFWWLRGHVAEGREQLEAALAVDGSTASAARATALDGAGVLAETQGDYDRAEALHRESLALSRERGDKTGIARALGNLGVVAFDRGDDDQATTLPRGEPGAGAGDRRSTPGRHGAQRSRERGLQTRRSRSSGTALSGKPGLRRQAGSGSEIARSLNNLGGVAFDRGDFDRACQLFAESVSLYRDAGDRWGAAGALIGLAAGKSSPGRRSTCCRAARREPVAVPRRRRQAERGAGGPQSRRRPAG